MALLWPVAAKTKTWTKQGLLPAARSWGAVRSIDALSTSASPAYLHGRVSNIQAWVPWESLKRRVRESPTGAFPGTVLLLSAQSPKQTGPFACNSATQCLGTSQAHSLHGTGARLPLGHTSTRTDSRMRTMLCSCNVSTPAPGPAQASKGPGSPTHSPGLPQRRGVSTSFSLSTCPETAFFKRGRTAGREPTTTDANENPSRRTQLHPQQLPACSPASGRCPARSGRVPREGNTRCPGSRDPRASPLPAQSPHWEGARSVPVGTRPRRPQQGTARRPCHEDWPASAHCRHLSFRTDTWETRGSLLSGGVCEMDCCPSPPANGHCWQR